MKKEEQAVNSYIEWQELNGIFGRIITILEATGSIPDESIVVDEFGRKQFPSKVGGTQVTSSKAEAVKSLVSEAIFNRDYKGFGVTESEKKVIESFKYYPAD